MKKAYDFYQQAFGWAISSIEGSSGGYHFARTSPSDDQGVPLLPGSINGGLFERGTHAIGSAFLEIEVESVDQTIERVLPLGGKLIREKRPMGDFGFFAIVQDPEGNNLGLMEYAKR